MDCGNCTLSPLFSLSRATRKEDEVRAGEPASYGLWTNLKETLPLEHPDITTLIGQLTSSYVKAVQRRPPHLTTPKWLLDTVSKGGPCSGRSMHFFGKFFKRLYGYKVISQFGIHVTSHLTKPVWTGWYHSPGTI